MLFAFKFSVSEIKERCKQKQPYVHFNVPGVVGTGKIKRSEYERFQVKNITLCNVFVNHTRKC